MMKTLSYFMSINERRMSCLLTNDTEKLPYLRDLYVQGIIHEDKVLFRIRMDFTCNNKNVWYSLIEQSLILVTALLESIDILS